VGFALIGVAAASSQGYRAALIYMTIYGLTSLGLFAAVLSMRRSDGMVETVADLGGLARTRPGFAVAISALLLSVGGIPPLFGFLGKWVVFEAGLTSGLTWLVLVGAVAAVVSLGYYLRLLKTIWIDPTAHTFERAPAGVTLALSGTAVVAVAGLAVLAGPITRLGGQLLP
jgi:NADH-quinone oxidoreductase subunit N